MISPRDGSCVGYVHIEVGSLLLFPPGGKCGAWNCRCPRAEGVRRYGLDPIHPTVIVFSCGESSLGQLFVFSTGADGSTRDGVVRAVP